MYELQRLRCNLCGEVYTAETPQDVGEEKSDEIAAAMIAQMKYSSGMAFKRLERQHQLRGRCDRMKFILREFGGRPLDGIKPQDIERWLSH